MRYKNRIFNFITELFRIVVGATFMFSGFVKAVDPLGFTYKIQDYLISFDLVSLFPLALPASIFVVVLEMLVGLFLLLGLYRRITTIAVGLFMLFFLPLTLWIALYNPVEDCGCFGDALVISNWQTFYKNIVLSVGAVILVYRYRDIKPIYSKRFSWAAALFLVIFGFSFVIYNTVKLPVFDFRPFKIGSNIAEQMHVDPEKGDVVENIFIYSKDGENKEFTEDNYPWDDSTWVYVDMESRIIEKGESPKIEDFHINLYVFDEDSGQIDKEDITDYILHDSSYSFLMVSCFLEDMNMKHYHKFVKAKEFANQSGIDFYILTSSLTDDIARWSEQKSDGFNFAEADERVLKTMIRSNPGLMLMHNGNVINKWDDSEVPVFFNTSIEEWDSTNKQNKNFWCKLVVISLLLLIPLTVLKIVDITIINKREI